MSDPDDPLAWLAKADNDLLNISNNLNDVQVPWDTLCYHAQQASEKALKAFIVSRSASPPRTHDLVSLLGECIALGGAFAGLHGDCGLLTRYAAAVRYPVINFDPSEMEGREAYAAAQRVCNSIRTVIIPPAP